MNISKELRGIHITLMVIFFSLIVGAAIIGTSGMEALITSITNSILAWVRIILAILIAAYIVILPFANHPLFFFRKTFLKTGNVWMRDDIKQKGEKEPYFWERRPSVKMTHVTNDVFR